MKPHEHVDVYENGAVLLGPNVVCDGFNIDSDIRVQSHIHSDHMQDFEICMQFQNIISSPETYDFILIEKNGAIPYHSNVYPVTYAKKKRIGNCFIKILPSGHMLGAIQAEVELSGGFRCGYSGDFSWPIEKIIKVDSLVVDCTCGTPRKIRKFSKKEVNERFIEIVLKSIKKGSVAVTAHRGTLQRSLELLDDVLKYPIIGTQITCEEAYIYKKYGYSIPEIIPEKSEIGIRILKENKYLRLYRVGEYNPNLVMEKTRIVLSAYMANPNEPVIERSNISYCICFSDHADYNETIEYIANTNAKYVVTDNTRGGHAVELAEIIKSRLSIKAMPSSNKRIHMNTNH